VEGPANTRQADGLMTTAMSGSSRALIQMIVNSPGAVTMAPHQLSDRGVGDRSGMDVKATRDDSGDQLLRTMISVGVTEDPDRPDAQTFIPLLNWP
jgi:hypothetical protein